MVQKAADLAGYALKFVERFIGGVTPPLTVLSLGYAGRARRLNRAARILFALNSVTTLLACRRQREGKPMIDEIQAPQQPEPVMAWKDVLAPLAWAAGAIFVLATKEGQQLPWWAMAAAVVVAVVAPLVALVYGLGAAREWTPDHTSNIAFKTIGWLVGTPIVIWGGYSLLTSAQTTLHDMPPWAGAIIGLQVYTLYIVYTRKPAS